MGQKSVGVVHNLQTNRMNTRTEIESLRNLNGFGAFNLIASSAMIEQFRFPRSGKKRIRNKWQKREANWRPMRNFFQMGSDIIGHPQAIAKLQRHFTTQPDNRTKG